MNHSSDRKYEWSKFLNVGPSDSKLVGEYTTTACWNQLHSHLDQKDLLHDGGHCFFTFITDSVSMYIEFSSSPRNHNNAGQTNIPTTKL